MKYNKLVCLLIVAISCATCAYGQTWKHYADSATAYQEKQQMDKAIEFHSKATEALKKDSAGTITYAASCNSLANLHLGMGQYERAKSLYLESKAIREQVLGKDHPYYANSCNNLANLYFHMGQYETAEALHLEAKAIRQKTPGKDHPDYARSCYSLANLYLTRGQYEKAEPLYLEAKAIWEKTWGKQHFNYAASCDNLATLYMKMGKYESAELLNLEAKAIWEHAQGKNHPDYARSCNNLAILYFKMGKYESAEPLYLEAKAIREKTLGKTHPDYTASCNNLAVLYFNMGNYEKAEPLYLEAKAIREQVSGKNHPDYAASCNGLANLYITMGQYEKAEPLYLEAKAIWEKALGKNHPDYAVSCNNLASLYITVGQYEKAEPLYLEAKAVCEKTLGKTHPDYARSCNNLANLYLTMEQHDKAESLYLEAKAIWGKTLGKDHRDYATSCSGLGNLYMTMRQYEKAEPLYLEAKAIREKTLGKNHPDYARSCDNLATLFWLAHQPLQAEKEFKESFSSNVSNLFSIFQFTNEQEKTAYVKNILGQDEKAYSFYANRNIASGQPYSLSLFHRNLILSSAQALKKQVSSSTDATVRDAYNKWTDLRKSLSLLYAEPISERKEDAAKIEEEAGQLEKKLTRLLPGFAKQQQRIEWNNIQNKLHTGEAAIEFVSFPYYNGKQYTDTMVYVALLLKKDVLLPTTIHLFYEKELTDLLSANGSKEDSIRVTKLYTSAAGHSENNLAVNKSVYDLIWRPLEKDLADINTIYFAPSGLLHRVAFAALPVTGKEVLSDRYKLIQLATTATVVDLPHSFVTPADKLQLYGGISYSADTTALRGEAARFHTKGVASRSLPEDLTRSGGFRELPYTRKEITGIASLARSNNRNISSRSGITATEESLKALDGNASPAVLHIATHGFFFPDPKMESKEQRSVESGKAFKLSDDPLMRSGLLFAGANYAWRNKPVAGIEDGILTAYEVSNMYLPNTKLVVLSACETGLGDIQGSEGVYGLQRAFKISGVENLVMSLWKVSDKATAEFMLAFYKSLFAGKSIGEAFSVAQTTMKNKYRKDPYKWAAWVLVR